MTYYLLSESRPIPAAPPPIAPTRCYIRRPLQAHPDANGRSRGRAVLSQHLSGKQGNDLRLEILAVDHVHQYCHPAECDVLQRMRQYDLDEGPELFD